MYSTVNVFYSYNGTLDIAIMIDGTFTSSEFMTVREFLVAFTDQFYVGPTWTRFGVVQFSQSASTTFGFTMYSTNAALRAGLTTMGQQQMGSVRNIASALTYTYSNLFSVQSRRQYAAWVYTHSCYHIFK